MNKKFQNIFFIFGLVVLCIMVYNLDFTDAWQKYSMQVIGSLL